MLKNGNNQEGKQMQLASYNALFGWQSRIQPMLIRFPQMGIQPITLSMYWLTQSILFLFAACFFAHYTIGFLALLSLDFVHNRIRSFYNEILDRIFLHFGVKRLNLKTYSMSREQATYKIMFSCLVWLPGSVN